MINMTGRVALNGPHAVSVPSYAAMARLALRPVAIEYGAPFGSLQRWGLGNTHPIMPHKEFRFALRLRHFLSPSAGTLPSL